ncbi:MAG: DUF5682 family protein [Planctomycetota bacterium]
MSSAWSVEVFGIRHLSPGGAWHVQRFLDRLRPSIVMIEAIADGLELTEHWVRRGTKPPFAILSYTTELPMRTFVAPIARYSPEYQAVLWAYRRRTPMEFIDLPSEVFLGLQEQERKRLERLQSEIDARSESEAAPTTASPSTMYDRVAELAGEPDYETFWERTFEHNTNDEAYRMAAMELGQSLRELEEGTSPRHAENLVREAYMRMRIQAAVDRGIAPGKIAVIVGAFHAPVMRSDQPIMTSDELARLPRRSGKLTLMPYSYFRLSSQSGYGAGNSAPAYFELMWDALERNRLDSLPAEYLSRLARRVREDGTHRSTAEVIEAVRLANTLAAMHDAGTATLRELHDAAVTLLGHGELAPIAQHIAHIDVGTAIGELPEGVSRTSIQEDFYRELSRLKLDKYRDTVKHELTLDLRENRQVKSESAAFLDLNRSTFFHRMRILEIPFATWVPKNQSAATWAEHWALQWTPECEIALVEAVLAGETIALATAFQFRQAIEKAESVNDASRLIWDACCCSLPTMMDFARHRLQALSTENSGTADVAAAAFQLMQVVKFGDVRRFDTSPLLPLILDLFVQGCLSLFDAANCDNDAAAQLMTAVDELNRVAFEFHDQIDENLWRRRLQELSDSDDRNPLLSGLACAILLERGWMSNEQLAREVSRRLSPGIAADLGAGWFEGIAGRNRYALIGRQILWEQLDQYVSELDEEQFRRALVFLRRAFGSFSPQEKRSIVENLSHVWGVDSDAALAVLDGPLSDQEEKALADLNEFDFGDL